MDRYDGPAKMFAMNRHPLQAHFTPADARVPRVLLTSTIWRSERHIYRGRVGLNRSHRRPDAGTYSSRRWARRRRRFQLAGGDRTPAGVSHALASRRGAGAELQAALLRNAGDHDLGTLRRISLVGRAADWPRPGTLTVLTTPVGRWPVRDLAPTLATTPVIR